MGNFWTVKLDNVTERRLGSGRDMDWPANYVDECAVKATFTACSAMETCSSSLALPKGGITSHLRKLRRALVPVDLDRESGGYRSLPVFCLAVRIVSRAA